MEWLHGTNRFETWEGVCLSVDNGNENDTDNGFYYSDVDSKRIKSSIIQC